MSSLNLKNLMTEYDLEIDDIRWYKSWVTSQELLSYAENMDDLVQLIWSGNLASRLHDMEDRFIEELRDQFERNIVDETGIREIFADAYALKNKRSWKD